MGCGASTAAPVAEEPAKQSAEPSVAAISTESLAPAAGIDNNRQIKRLSQRRAASIDEVGAGDEAAAATAAHHDAQREAAAASAQSALAPGSGTAGDELSPRINQRRAASMGDEALDEAAMAAEAALEAAQAGAPASRVALAPGSGFVDESARGGRINQRRAASIGDEALDEAMAATKYAETEGLEAVAPEPAAAEPPPEAATEPGTEPTPAPAPIE